MHYDDSNAASRTHSQAFSMMTRSQTRLAQQDEAAKVASDLQTPITIAKRGTPLPYIPKDATKSQVTKIPLLLLLLIPSPVCLTPDHIWTMLIPL